MKVVLEDSQTGERREWPAGDPRDVWWWTEGNGSCDCNRRRLFGDDDWSGLCLGTYRYYVVSVDPMPNGFQLFDFNPGYPEREGNT